VNSGDHFGRLELRGRFGLEAVGGALGVGSGAMRAEYEASRAGNS
jgi:hypothetical protein